MMTLILIIIIIKFIEYLATTKSQLQASSEERQKCKYIYGQEEKQLHKEVDTSS
jgi:hypothetical protein